MFTGANENRENDDISYDLLSRILKTDTEQQKKFKRDFETALRHFNNAHTATLVFATLSASIPLALNSVAASVKIDPQQSWIVTFSSALTGGACILAGIITKTLETQVFESQLKLYKKEGKSLGYFDETQLMLNFKKSTSNFFGNSPQLSDIENPVPQSDTDYQPPALKN